MYLSLKLRVGKFHIRIGSTLPEVTYTLASPTIGSYKIIVCWDGDPRREKLIGPIVQWNSLFERKKTMRFGDPFDSMLVKMLQKQNSWKSTML